MKRYFVDKYQHYNTIICDLYETSEVNFIKIFT